MGIMLLLLMVMLLYLLLVRLSGLNTVVVAKLLAGAALRSPPHPLPHSVWVSVPVAAAVPGDDKAAHLHVSRDPSGAVPHAIARAAWQCCGCRCHHQPPHHRPATMSDSMRDGSRWIRRGMKKNCLIRRHSSSRRNSNVSLAKYKEPHTRYRSPHALAFPASLLLFQFGFI